VSQDIGNIPNPQSGIEDELSQRNYSYALPLEDQGLFGFRRGFGVE